MRSTGELSLNESLIFGSTQHMHMLRMRVKAIAKSDVPILIQGETGSGKDVMAKLIHHLSHVASGPFVKVNCPAIPNTLFENELFGHEKGSYTGAIGTKIGRLALAHGGTLFLDEIGELDLSAQAKLLQVLQDGRFCPIGGIEEKKVDVRVICATNRDLSSAVAAGRFREDLYYRINGVSMRLLPVRERWEDIPDLVDHFLEMYNEKFNRRSSRPSPATILRMQEYPWPGNLRQLENVMKRYVVLGFEQAIAAEFQNENAESYDLVDVPTDRPISLKKITREAVRRIEKRVILKVMHANHGDRKKTARQLNISCRALHYKMKDAGIPPRGQPRQRNAEATGVASCV